MSPVWDGGQAQQSEPEREQQDSWENLDGSDGDLPWEGEKPVDAPEPWREGYPGSETPTPEEQMFREMLDDDEGSEDGS